MITLNPIKSKLANLKYPKISDKMKVIGVMGTRGKTSTVHILADLFKNAGQKVGYVSTIDSKIDNELPRNDISANYIETGMLHKKLHEMRKNGLEWAIVELTSKNALERGYEGISFDLLILTNLYGDSLNKYKTADHYFDAKRKLIKQVKDKGHLIANAQDERLTNWVRNVGDSLQNQIYLDWFDLTQISNLNSDLTGTRFSLNSRNYRSNLIGWHNTINSALAIKALSKFMDDRFSESVYEQARTPRGRMDLVFHSPYKVIIDYSYTPEMLEDSLKFLSTVKKESQNLITVFGCAGERDQSRRKMGAVAAKYSSMVILTSEDPKREKVSDINSQIFEYGRQCGGVLAERIETTEEFNKLDLTRLSNKIRLIRQNADVPFLAFDADHFTSRLDAVTFALKAAAEDDIVYVTGKGHEKSLLYKNVEYEWSDYDAVRESLSRLSF
jgi:UDP-N-acetylmuramoyl-L-alanyl-D-glutamate--2,6-diaminopimelate ligase